MRQLLQRYADDPIRRGMIGSTIEGSLFQVWFSAVSGNFLTGMALYLGAGGLTLGVLGSTPHMATMLQLVFAPAVGRLHRRRLAIALFTGLQRFGSAIAGLVALSLYPSPWAVSVFVVLFTLSWVFVAPGVLIWQGYMGDLVPPEIRGSYFAGRVTWSTASAMLMVLLYGAVLDRWPGHPGFELLYIGALIGAALNFGSFWLQPELPPREQPVRRPVWDVLRAPLRQPGPPRTAALFFGAWAFAQGMSVPFFPLLLMDRLGLSFSQVSVLATIASAAAIVTLRFVGRLQDRVGEARVISSLTGTLGLAPALLLLGGAGGWPVLILAHLLVGVSQTALQVSIYTLNLRLFPASDRSTYFAFFAALAGSAGFVTPILAGPFTGGRLEELFLLSALLSLALALLWHLRLRDRLGAHV